jgi:chemotaxis protein CheC
LALSRWLGRPSRISVEQVEQVPLSAATEVLGNQEDAVCACVMTLNGRVTGELMLAFDDVSGLALADLLLGNRTGTATQWGELEQSAALETANIIGCAYLNSLARCFPETDGASDELVPSPPKFVRDFAESLMEFALMNQAMTSDVVFLTRTEFRVDGAATFPNFQQLPLLFDRVFFVRFHPRHGQRLRGGRAALPGRRCPLRHRSFRDRARSSD